MKKDLYMLVTRPGLNKNMLFDEQVTMYLHIISHHFQNRVIKHHFNRSTETVSRSFYNVLNAVIHLQDVLFKRQSQLQLILQTQGGNDSRYWSEIEPTSRLGF
ncbi:hypothetical protein Gotur_035598 [Gossypium turneri]